MIFDKVSYVRVLFSTSCLRVNFETYLNLKEENCNWNWNWCG